MSVHSSLLALCVVVPLLHGCATRAVTDTTVEPTITASEAERVASTEDPFNASMLSALAPGMVVALRITPTAIELKQAYMMLTPKTPRSAEGSGDRITASLFSGRTRVSQTAVGDPIRSIDEEFGQEGDANGRISRHDERTVALALPTPNLVDALAVTVTATGQTARFDVAIVMQAYCAGAPREPSCKPPSAERSR